MISNDWLVYPPRPAWCEVETTAIVHNTERACRLAAPAPVMAVVKADGFGHGIVETARAALAGGARHLGVAVPEEGIALRRAGIQAPITVLGTIVPRLAEVVVDFDLAVALCTPALADALDDAARSRGRQARAHVKVDTGVHRIGLPPGEVPAFLHRLQGLPRITVEGMFSILADDHKLTSFAAEQFRVFTDLVAQLAQAGLRPPIVHFSNSVPLSADHEMKLDMVRVGRLLFGFTPWNPGLASQLELRPALKIRCEVVFLNRVPRGDTIGFDRSLHAAKDTTLAIIPVGFADVGRFLHGNSRTVLVKGRRARVLSIASDQAMVDVTELPDTVIGDVATLLGSQDSDEITIHEVMAQTGLSAGTLCTGLSRRLARVYLRNGIGYRLQGFLDRGP